MLRLPKGMKQLWCSLMLLLVGYSANAQDIIVKNNGDEIKSNVVEITLKDEIKYELYHGSNDSLRTLSADNVFMIIYENGKREVFKDEKNDTEEVSKKPAKEKVAGNSTDSEEQTKESESDQVRSEKKVSETEKTSTQDSEYLNEKDEKTEYVSIGLGVGPIYSRLGGKITVRPGNTIGFHGSLGYNEVLNQATGSGILYSFGMQIFTSENFYFDIAYGTLARAGLDHETGDKIKALSGWVGYGIELSESIVIDLNLGLMRDFKEYPIENSNENYGNGALGGNWWWGYNAGLEIRL